MQGEAFACCNLGVLHYRQQQYDEALTQFERFFEAARALKDQRVLDVARLNLGAVRAALNFKDYIQVGLLKTLSSAEASIAVQDRIVLRLMQVANTDLQTLMLWKNVRMPITEQAPVPTSVS